MKLGYVSDTLTQGDAPGKKWTINEYLEKVSHIGYDSVEIFTFPGQATYPFYLNKKNREDLIEKLDELNLYVSNVGAYGGMMLCSEFGYLTNDEMERKFTVNYLKNCIDLAVELNCKTVGDLVGIKPIDLDIEKAWERAANSLGQVCDYAGDRGINIAVEIGTKLKAPRVKLVHSAETFLELIKNVKSNSLKCLYDPSNIIMGGVENWLEGVDLISKHLAHVQLKGLMRGDMTYGYNFTRPCSEYDLTPQKEFLNKLKNIGYNDSICIEEFPSLYTDAAKIDWFESAKLAYQDVNQLFDEVNYKRD